MTKTKDYAPTTNPRPGLSTKQEFTQIFAILEREMSPEIYRAMDRSLRNYKDIPEVEDGIRFAVGGMLLSVVWSQNERSCLDVAARFFSRYFGDKKLVSLVHDAFSSVSAISDDKQLLRMNAEYAFYDKNFRVRNFGQSHLLRREVKCPKNADIFIIDYAGPEAEQNLSTIKSVYQFYPEAHEFFSKYGFKIGTLPIFVEKRLSADTLDKENNVSEEPVGGYYNTASMNIHLNNKFSPEKTIHELTHHLQWVNSILRRNKLGDIGANELVSGNMEIKEMLNTFFVEAGASFAQKLYLSNKKCKGPKQTVLALSDTGVNYVMEKYLNDDKIYSLKYADLRSKAKTEFISLLELAYFGLKELGIFDVNKSRTLERFRKDVRGNFGRVYTLSAAFAILTYASNEYDATKTMHDLIDSEKMKNLIYKLNDAVSTDNNSKILESIRDKMG